jgi:plastocyanin
MIFLAILILGFNDLDVRAQESNSTIVLNPGATNSDSQNPISSANVTVPAGTNVTWVNKDSSPHMLVSGSPEEGPDNIFYGDFFGTNENYTVTFDKPGLYSYYDPAWSHIRGEITVENPEFSTNLGSSLNTSSIGGIGENLVPDSNTNVDVTNSDGNRTNTENDSFSIPTSSFLSSFPSSATNDTSDQSFPVSSLASDQALSDIFNKVGPLLGLLMSGGGSPSSSSSSSSPLSSFSQSDGMFGQALTDTANFSNSESGDVLLSDQNSSSLLNDTFTLQNKSITLLDEERVAVQKELINILKKAYSVGAELPELPSFLDEGDNATIFIKVNVINPIDKKANASDFPIKINYEYGDGIPSVSYTYANDAGRIEAVPASIYAILADPSQTSDQGKDTFLNSYTTSYSKGCSGHIDYSETKDCVITKKYTDMTNNINITSGS